jgi:hypothetical protein
MEALSSGRVCAGGGVEGPRQEAWAREGIVAVVNAVLGSLMSLPGQAPAGSACIPTTCSSDAEQLQSRYSRAVAS